MPRFLLLAAILTLVSINTNAQQPALTGKWQTPDGAVIQFGQQGGTLTARQISSKDKKNDDKIVARNVSAVSTGLFEGTVIDPKDNKAYKGRFVMNETGTELELKVKWRFISFNETWKRVK
jgi:uncharacterized protein (DUF2147 family)